MLPLLAAAPWLLAALLPLQAAGGGHAPSPAQDEPARALAEGRAFRETLGSDVAFEMAPIPGADGRPAFWIGRTEVTWDVYDHWRLLRDATVEADAQSRPSKPYGAPDRGFGVAGRPALHVTRHAAEEFCAWLRARTGRAYRLPTEAEWVTACADGGGAWTRANAERRTHPVASLAANRHGVHDMLGNAAEWCAGDDPVVRGGSYLDPEEDVTKDLRRVQSPAWNRTDPQFPKSRWWLSDGGFIGFRLALDAPAAAARTSRDGAESGRSGDPRGDDEKRHDE